MISEKVKNMLKKQHYVLVGKHSALQICRWTKKSLISEGFCFKEKFYGIESHRCCQMTPMIFCPNKCLHCWRPIEINEFNKIIRSVQDSDDLKEIINKCILAQRKMLTGFKGNTKLNKKKFKEAQEPKNFAISLIGEPTMYEKIGELMGELRKRGKTSFLVINGLFPEKLKELIQKNQLPTQIYISLNSPDKKQYEKWHRSIMKDAWKKFNQSLELMKKMRNKTRTVIRITLVKGENMADSCGKNVKNYSKLIKKALPDFIEVKGYMAVGFARKRFDYEKMPSHEEIKQFTKKLVEELNRILENENEIYKILNEKIESRVVLLGKSKEKMKISKI